MTAGCMAVCLCLLMLMGVGYAGEDGVVLQVGPDSPLTSVRQALDQLAEGPAIDGPLTLQLTGSTTDQVGDKLVISNQLGITQVTVEAVNDGEFTIGGSRTALLANGIPLTWKGGNIDYLYGGGLNHPVASTQITITGGYVNWVLGGGLASQEGASARVSGQSRVVFSQVKMPTRSDNEYVWGGGRAESADSDASVGAAQVEIQNCVMRREVMGGGEATARNANAKVDQVTVIVTGSTLEGDVYGGGESSGRDAQAGSKAISVSILDSQFPIYNGSYGGNILGGGFVMNNPGSVNVSDSITMQIQNSEVTAAIGGGLAMSSNAIHMGTVDMALDGSTVRDMICGSGYSLDGVASVQADVVTLVLSHGLIMTNPEAAIDLYGYVEENGSAQVTGESKLVIKDAPVSIPNLYRADIIELEQPLEITGECDADGPIEVRLLGDGWQEGMVALTVPQETQVAITSDFLQQEDGQWSFANPSYTVDIVVEGQGQASPAGVVTVPYGQDLTVTFTPDPGQQLAQVWLDGQPVEDADLQICLERVKADHHIRVQFEPQPVAGAKTLVDQATGLTVTAEAGVLPQDAVLQVEIYSPDALPAQMREALAGRLEAPKAYRVQLHSQGQLFLPTGPVQVCFPLAQGELETPGVYALTEDGAAQMLEAQRTQTGMAIATQRLGYFAIGNIKKEGAAPTASPTPQPQQGAEIPTGDAPWVGPLLLLALASAGCMGLTARRSHSAR